MMARPRRRINFALLRLLCLSVILLNHSAGFSTSAASGSDLILLDRTEESGFNWQDRFGGGVPTGATMTYNGREWVVRGTNRIDMWGRVYRQIEVDLDRYPELLINVHWLSRQAFVVIVCDKLEEQYKRLADITVPGIYRIDIPGKTGLSGRQKIRIEIGVTDERPRSDLNPQMNLRDNLNAEMAVPDIRFIDRTASSSAPPTAVSRRARRKSIYSTAGQSLLLLNDRWGDLPSGAQAEVLPNGNLKITGTKKTDIWGCLYAEIPIQFDNQPELDIKVERLSGDGYVLINHPALPGGYSRLDPEILKTGLFRFPLADLPIKGRQIPEIQFGVVNAGGQDATGAWMEISRIEVVEQAPWTDQPGGRDTKLTVWISDSDPAAAIADFKDRWDVISAGATATARDGKFLVTGTRKNDIWGCVYRTVDIPFDADPVITLDVDSVKGGGFFILKGPGLPDGYIRLKPEPVKAGRYRYELADYVSLTNPESMEMQIGVQNPKGPGAIGAEMLIRSLWMESRRKSVKAGVAISPVEKASAKPETAAAPTADRQPGVETTAIDLISAADLTSQIGEFMNHWGDINSGASAAARDGLMVVRGTRTDGVWGCVYRSVTLMMDADPVLDLDVRSVTGEGFLILKGPNIPGDFVRLQPAPAKPGRYRYHLSRVISIRDPIEAELQLGVVNVKGPNSVGAEISIARMSIETVRRPEPGVALRQYPIRRLDFSGMNTWTAGTPISGDVNIVSGTDAALDGTITVSLRDSRQSELWTRAFPMSLTGHARKPIPLLIDRQLDPGIYSLVLSFSSPAVSAHRAEPLVVFPSGRAVRLQADVDDDGDTDEILANDAFEAVWSHALGGRLMDFFLRKTRRSQLYRAYPAVPRTFGDKIWAEYGGSSDWFPSGWPGKVWNNTWSYRAIEETPQRIRVEAKTEVEGGLKLAREMIVRAGDTVMEVTYTVENASAGAAKYVWAAHPDAAPGGQAGPEDEVVSGTWEMKYRGDLTKDQTGGGAGWVEARDGKTGEYVRVEFPADKAERLGMWHGKNFFTMEPMLKEATLAAGQTDRFVIRYTVGSGR